MSKNGHRFIQEHFHNLVRMQNKYNIYIIIYEIFTSISTTIMYSISTYIHTIRLTFMMSTETSTQIFNTHMLKMKLLIFPYNFVPFTFYRTYDLMSLD